MCRAAVRWTFRERFCDAEIQQFRSAVRADEDVAGLQIAVRDQIAVRVGHGLGDLYEQRDARVDVELLAVAGAVQRFAFDIFHDQIRAAVAAASAVEQMRDARVGQRRQDLPFSREAFEKRVRFIAQPQQFQCTGLMEPGVVAFDQIDRAHAAMADPAQRLPHANAFGQRVVRVIAGRRSLEQRTPARGPELRWLQRFRRIGGEPQQFTQRAAECGVLRVDRAYEGLACAVVQIQRFFEQRVQADARVVCAGSGRGWPAHGGSIACNSQARARIQLRCTVRSDDCMASAVSSSVMPAK